MKLRLRLGCALLGAVLASALSGCSATLDSLGKASSSNGGSVASAGSAGNAGGAGSAGTAGSAGSAGVYNTIREVTGPDTYYNAFGTLLGKSEDEITKKLGDGFQQLFYGNDDQVIFLPHQPPDDGAVIKDILHNDYRTEGMGLAMLITVELDKRSEFEQLWRYAKSTMEETSGPAKGYFNSRCGEDEPAHCYDAYGMQHFVLALMLANSRWRTLSDVPYASDALSLLDSLQNKEAENGGVVMGIGNAFDAQSHLVREEPTLADAGFTTRSALQMPAAYWYWGQATGNPFWSAAASAARTHLLAVADGKTGLAPMRSYFDGSPVDDSPGFTAQAYRTELNLAIDALWGTAGADQTNLADRTLDFFYGKGINTYGATFRVDGTSLDTNRAQALIAVNGALVTAASTSAKHTEFVNAVWSQAIPDDDNRYYDGLLYLSSLLVLSGRMRVY